MRKEMTLLEPIKPIPLFTYRCDSKFVTEPLREMLESNEKYGFLVIDGNGCLFAVVQGNVQTELFRYAVSLPKKHHKGGQSAQRFGRLRLESRHNYLTKVAEFAVKYFIDSETCQVNVNGIVLAGSASFKDEFNDPKITDRRILAKIIGVVDVAYGFKQGLQQAVELASDMLKGVSIVHQKKLMSQFFGELEKDSGRVCFGVKETMAALDSGAVETLLTWEKCDVVRYKIVDSATGKEEILFGKQDKSPIPEGAKTKEIVDSELLVDWLVDHYQEFGTQLEIVQDSSAEGSQFCKGFGGFGGILRYKMEFQEEPNDSKQEEMNDEEEGSSDDDLSSYF